MGADSEIPLRHLHLGRGQGAQDPEIHVQKRGKYHAPETPPPFSLFSLKQTQGFYDMEYSWRIRTIAPFADQPSFAAISTKKIRIGSYEWGGYDAHSESTGDEFLDVLVGGEDGDELVLIGRSNSRGKIKAFRVQRGEVRGLEGVGKGVDTGIGDYNPLTDCCCLVREAGYGKRGMLIAKVKGREGEGKLSVCYLD